ncbi:HPr family phosphocarrier protein [Nevskia soli]|uniref:HPr family phosphocarrier protein n=1 Tax=Nevskia soli TaxID=418856 RepID=UPI0004A6E93F|nr:HPr family phosphocarrier protein [Nevskia soli]
MDKSEYQPIEKTVTIVNRLGLHARAAAKLVTLAAKHQSDVVVRKDGREVSGKSIMGVMMLAAAQGSHITLVAQGPDAAEALEALAALIANRFDEEA